MSTPSLDRLRAAIDETDLKLLELLALRLAHCSAIGAIKQQYSLPVRVESREADVLLHVTKAGAALGLDATFVNTLWCELMGEARRIQTPRENAGTEIIPTA